MKVKRPDWSGQTVVCIASGPSLTSEDCECVRAARHPVIVTNTTFKLAPWADVVFGYDAAWWRQYFEEAKKSCAGRLMSVAQAGLPAGVESLFGCDWFTRFSNSGTSAISLAVAGRAAKVVMLGYDCQKTGGAVHWHGDHQKGLSNAISMRLWPQQFELVAAHARRQNVKVVNASRETALKCFETKALELAL